MTCSKNTRPARVYFEPAQWKALRVRTGHNPNPRAEDEPSLREAMRLVAALGGFLGRKCDGEPGTQTLWHGLQRLDDITVMYRVLTKALRANRDPP
nr:IS4 family transposase [Nitrococcus mobilis]